MAESDHLHLVNPDFDSAPLNQGRFVRPESVRTWNQLHFSTQSELRFAQALDQARVFFAPLAGCRVTEEDGVRRTRELDFLVVDNGVVAVVELDGAPHNGRAADDHRRDRAIKRSGIWLVERFNSAEVLRDPESVVRRVRRMMRFYKRTA